MSFERIFKGVFDLSNSLRIRFLIWNGLLNYKNFQTLIKYILTNKEWRNKITRGRVVYKKSESYSKGEICFVFYFI